MTFPRLLSFSLLFLCSAKARVKSSASFLKFAQLQSTRAVRIHPSTASLFPVRNVFTAAQTVGSVERRSAANVAVQLWNIAVLAPVLKSYGTQLRARFSVTRSNCVNKALPASSSSSSSPFALRSWASPPFFAHHAMTSAAPLRV